MAEFVLRELQLNRQDNLPGALLVRIDDRGAGGLNDWLKEYNEVRPHGSLKGGTSAQFLRNWANQDQVH